jgi:glutamate--cysteine ligase
MEHKIAKLIEQRLLGQASTIEAWFVEKRAEFESPLYASFDVRDAGWKAAIVDANAFPAGFNNPPPEQRELLSKLLTTHIDTHQPDAEHILLFPEANTRNTGYAENVRVLASLLSSIEREVVIGAPRLNGIERLVGIEGSSPLVEVDFSGEGVMAGGRAVDLVILNDDLTVGGLPDIETPVMPPVGLGWFNRKKSGHFAALQPLLDEIAEILGIDSWFLGTHWFVSLDKCLDRDTCRNELAAEVDHCLEIIADKYRQYGIDASPSMFIKNDSGTYGLGILRIESGEDLLALSNRKMNRLTYGKGGSDVEDFLLQESVPTALRNGNQVLEPCGYAASGETVAWFLRANSKKGVVDNLNTPSTTFLHSGDLTTEARLVMKRRESLHRVLSDVASLAIAREAAALE